jgi:hypothetical protein
LLKIGGFALYQPFYPAGYDSCREINPFIRDASDLRGNDYRDWLVEAINWQNWTGGDPELTLAFQQELKPFAMQDVVFEHREHVCFKLC